MGGFVVRKLVTRAIVLGAVIGVPQIGISQDQDHPILNSIGRFLGVGYTHGGYHAAADGRFNLVTDRHPAPAYRSGQLLSLYSPHYGAPATAFGNSAGAQPTGAGGGAIEVAPLPPPKPVGPPPEWLKTYLQDDAPAASSAPAFVPLPPPNRTPVPSDPIDIQDRDLSPSDRLLPQAEGEVRYQVPGARARLAVPAMRTVGTAQVATPANYSGYIHPQNR